MQAKHLSRAAAVVVALLVLNLSSALGLETRDDEDADLLQFGESEYELGPEDLIEVFVWKEPDLSTEAVIRPDGFISLPLVDEIEAGGKSVKQLQRDIRARLSEFIAEPIVSVIVKEVRHPKVTVLGEVRAPNVYRIGQKATVLDAIAMAGGFTEFAARDEVTVIRESLAGFRRIRLNVKDLVDGRGELFLLRPADTVYVR